MPTGSWLRKLSRASVLTLLCVACPLCPGQATSSPTNAAARPASSSTATPAPNATTPTATATPNAAAAGQTQQSQAPGTSPATTVSPTVNTTAPAPPRVSAIETRRAGLGDLVTLRVDNLATLVQQSKCAGAGVGVNCQKQEIILFLNGRPLAGDGPEVLLPEDNLVQFHLSRKSGTDDLWEDLLGSPQGFVKEVKASVGLANGYPLEGGQTMELIVMQEWWFWGCFILLAAVLLSTVYLARRTSLLRNSNRERNDRKLYPYSLGRTQMAFWFLLVVISFLLIWLITGEYDAITSSTLVLIGIGAGTALGADLVDNNKNSTNDDLIADYRTEQAALTSRIDEIKTALAVDPKMTPGTTELQPELVSQQARLGIVEAALAQLQTQTLAPCSEGFFKDILNDNHGISFHRFQIVVWTIVLGIIFIESVYSHLAMPEFSGTLLALMGISSGTYLGFKGTENK